MKQKAHISFVLTLILVATPLLPAVLSAQPVHAGGGIVLRPPFDGTYRVTVYFDHNDPNYAEDGYNWIYIGERAPATGYPLCTDEPYPYDGHDGWDWSMYKEDILAAADGVVEFVGWYYGLTIAIEHSNNYHTYYSHLNAVQSGISVGTFVEAGQLIGESGDSGAEGSWHLHFGVRHGADWNNGGYSTDPFGWRGSGRDPLFDYNGKESSCLWAGVPGDDISCADIIVEDDGAGWTELGTWFTSSNGNGYREHHTYSWDPPPSSAVHWMPTLPARGYYQVYAFIPPIGSPEKPLTAHAEYNVDTGLSQHTAVLDQGGTAAPSWRFLTRAEFLPGAYGWVNLDDYTGEPQNSRVIAADALKFTAGIVYLPDVRNCNGWTSSIIIRNNSAASMDLGINYYNSGGGLVDYQEAAIVDRGIAVKTPPSGFSGSAVVVGDQDVSVVVENRKSGEATNYNGIAASDPLNPGWGEAGTTIYAPSVKHGLYGRTGYLFLMNAGSGEATVTPSFRARDNGSAYTCSNLTMPPQGSYLYAPEACNLPSGQLYAAKLTSDQPLAVVVVEQNDSGAALAATSNALSAGAASHWTPLVKRDYWGNSTSLVVQNVGSNAWVTVAYYDRDQSWSDSASYYLEANLSHVFPAPSGMPSGIGSARVTATQPLAATVYEHRLAGDWRMQHNGFLGGSRTVVLPRVYKNYLSGGVSWSTGFQVQKVSAGTAHVTVRYYDLTGNTNANWNQSSVISSDWRAITFNTSSANLPDGFVGSAIVTADQNIVAEANVANTGGGDGAMSYNGVNR